jgi:hypothetical protein|tara:strand:- start:1294 stop:1806 length:513 start_codon:yes stop_codon:yes gene_type:complete
MITKINTNILESTNKRIIDILFGSMGWRFATDTSNKNINKSDFGFILSSLNEDQKHLNNEILNTYAYFILDNIQNNSSIKFKKIKRLYWNWYHPGSQMEFHTDENNDNNYSILYNLHKNDGGTQFIVNEKKFFYESIESEALVFPSKLSHRGIAPKKNLNRFALNIVTEI